MIILSVVNFPIRILSEEQKAEEFLENSKRIPKPSAFYVFYDFLQRNLFLLKVIQSYSIIL
jgi:hypothetical protein